MPSDDVELLKRVYAEFMRDGLEALRAAGVR
jgi:hypothetical protein